MNPFEFLAVAVIVLGIAGVSVVDKLSRLRRRDGEYQVQLAEQHIQELTARVADLERHNDELRQQLEWNRRLLEAQDRVLQQLGPPSSSPPPLSRV